MILRPDDIKIKVLDELLFQERAVSVYKSAVAKKKQVFLFYGPSGCGKTTLAKLHALTYSFDEDSNSITADFINCANNGSVDEIRTLIECFSYYPLNTGKRVVILDEAQVLSKQAQTALMIPLESLPSFVDVIICTMNKDKLDQALISRSVCVEFSSFSKKNLDEMLDTHFKEKDYNQLLTCLKKSKGNFRSFLQYVEHGVEDNEIDKLALMTINNIVNWNENRVRETESRISDFNSFSYGFLDIVVDALVYSMNGGEDDKYFNKMFSVVDKNSLFKIHKLLLEYLSHVNIINPNSYLSLIFYIRGELNQ